MKSRQLPKIPQKRIKELERIATRIEGRMTKLERIVADLSKGLTAK